MELKLAVLDGVRERTRRLNAYLGDEECPELWALDALTERLCELEEFAGVVVGPHTWIDGAPDFGDGDELRRELEEIYQDLRAAEFVVDVFRDLEELYVDGPETER